MKNLIVYVLFFLGWTKLTGGQPQLIIKTIDCMIIFEESSNWKSNSMILFFHPSVLFLLKMCAKTKSWFLGSFNFWFGSKQTHLFFNRYSAFFFFSIDQVLTQKKYTYILLRGKCFVRSGKKKTNFLFPRVMQGYLKNFVVFCWDVQNRSVN